ncbi:MAG: hypothetical protein AB7P76_07030 [Candidatus Melainabacteria bacterium]
MPPEAMKPGIMDVSQQPEGLTSWLPFFSGRLWGFSNEVTEASHEFFSALTGHVGQAWNPQVRKGLEFLTGKGFNILGWTTVSLYALRDIFHETLKTYQSARETTDNNTSAAFYAAKNGLASTVWQVAGSEIGPVMLVRSFQKHLVEKRTTTRHALSILSQARLNPDGAERKLLNRVLSEMAMKEMHTQQKGIARWLRRPHPELHPELRLLAETKGTKAAAAILALPQTDPYLNSNLQRLGKNLIQHDSRLLMRMNAGKLAAGIAAIGVFTKIFDQLLDYAREHWLDPVLTRWTDHALQARGLPTLPPRKLSGRTD